MFIMRTECVSFAIVIRLTISFQIMESFIISCFPRPPRKLGGHQKSTSFSERR